MGVAIRMPWCAFSAKRLVLGGGKYTTKHEVFSRCKNLREQLGSDRSDCLASAGSESLMNIDLSIRQYI